MYVNEVTRGDAPFFSLGYNLNNLGRGPPDNATCTYDISKAWAFYFQTRRVLKFFPTCISVKQVNNGAGPFLTPEGYNLNNLGKSLLDEATYQMSKAWDF